MALRRPAAPSAGDMWLCKRLGFVRVFNGHKRGQRRGQWPNDFSLYHFGKRALIAHPYDWRDNDNNASSFDPDNDCGEKWKYLGNIFDMLPYESFLKANP